MNRMEIELSPELAFGLTNIVVGDGNVTKWKNKYKTKNGQKIRIVYIIEMTNVDKQHVEAFTECICKVLDKKKLPKLYLRYQPKYKPFWRVRINIPKEFYEWIQSIKQNDGFLEELWRTYSQEFLQSWFDSDGSASMNGVGLVLSLTNSRKKWLEFAQELLQSVYGIKFNLLFNQYLKSGKTQWTLSTTIHKNIEVFYNQIKFGIPRKQRILKNWLQQ